MVRAQSRAQDPDESPGPGAGLATDSRGNPVVDPTKNVLNLVDAAVARLDDLRLAEKEYARRESEHVWRMLDVRAHHYEELRRSEANRIDAIRAVDVGNVQRAAETMAIQAQTLATQVAASAEALRTQVAAAATAAATNLAAALEPIQKDIQDLRRAQYEAQGKVTQTTDTRLNASALIAAASVVFSLVIGVIVILISLR